MSRTALLAMDFQVAHVNRMPGDYLPLAARALDSARARDIPVIHVALQLRADHVDVHPRNKMFGALRPQAFTAADADSAIHPDVAPLGGEIVVHKNRVSAFAGNNLHQILAAQDIDHLVLAGVATSGIVLSTLLQAVDLDYRVTVLADACADPSPDLHHTLVNDVYPRRGEVTTVDDWAKASAANLEN
jgi:nicotinamidase-related amidase